MSERTVQISITALRDRPTYGISTARGVMANLAQWELLALVDAVEQMEREHSHHHIPGTVSCHGCALLARFDFGEDV